MDNIEGEADNYFEDLGHGEQSAMTDTFTVVPVVDATTPAPSCPVLFSSPSTGRASVLSSSSSSQPSRCPAMPHLPNSTATTSLMPAPTDVVYGSQAFTVNNSTVTCGLGIAINTALMGPCEAAQLQLAIYQTGKGPHVTQMAATANVAVYSTQAPDGGFLYIPFVGGSVQLNASATYLFEAGFTAGSALQVYVNTSQSAPSTGKFQYAPVTSPLPVDLANFNFHGTVSQSLAFAQGGSCDCFTASALQPAQRCPFSSSSSTASSRPHGRR